MVRDTEHMVAMAIQCLTLGTITLKSKENDREVLRISYDDEMKIYSVKRMTLSRIEESDTILVEGASLVGKASFTDRESLADYLTAWINKMSQALEDDFFQSQAEQDTTVTFEDLSTKSE